MAKTYADLEEMKMGRQANIQKEADNQIENELAQKEREVAVGEAQASDQMNQSIQEDAFQIVQEMDQIHDKGGDPMEIYQQLRPEMQEAVSVVLQQQGQEEQTAQGQEQAVAQGQEQTMQTIPEEQQASTKEQDDSILQMAQQLLAQ